MTNKKTALYQFLDEIKYAKLDCKGKALLYFYAASYNWTKNKPSWYSQRSVSALTGMAASTYHEYQKYLINLGWIKVKKRGRNAQNLVWVCKGKDDPDYEKHSWAKWHPFNIERDPNFMEEMKDFDPFFDLRNNVEKDDGEDDAVNSEPLGSPPKGGGSAEEIWKMFENSSR
jgi:hypothetical protein